MTTLSVFSQNFNRTEQASDFFSGNQAPKREIRAMWLTTIGGIDWPHSYAQSASSIQKQKQELINILDKLQKANINTVLLQTRVRGTTIYPSSMEPWDGCLSGNPGKSPGYDALQFAIDECHKRGMELHAWVVTIPVGKWNKLGCTSLRNKFPGLIMQIGEDGYMNPEDSRTGDYLAQICNEITSRYDIDGIHLDYIRYPENKKIKVPLDQGREYITSIVKKIHDAVKSQKPWVKLSCSPIGKYSDLPRHKSRGWNAYERVCQDAQAWLRDGLMDQLYPMMYFKGENFFPFANDWAECTYGKMVAPGLGIYFLDPELGNWKVKDIITEMYHLRNLNTGHTYFRSKFFTDNHQGIYDFASNEFDKYPALVPADTWSRREKTDTTYNIYASFDYPVDTRDARNLIGTRLPKSEVLKYLSGVQDRYVVLTYMDRYGVEIGSKEIETAWNAMVAQNKELARQDSILRMEKKKKQMEIDRRVSFKENVLMVKDKKLQVPPKRPGLDADYIVVQNLLGNMCSMRRYTGESIYVGNLKEGIYELYSMDKMHIKHRLGIFIIEKKTFQKLSKAK